MFCQLGSFIFDKSKSPSSISNDLEITYAEHSLMNQANRLQPTGRGLKEMNLELYLHVEFSKVQQDIDALKKAASEYEVLPFLWGTGRVEGNFVITKISEDDKWRDDIGNLMAASLTISLREFVGNPMERLQAEATKKAFATGNHPNVTGKKAGATPAKPTAGNTNCNNTIATFCSQLRAIAEKTKAQNNYFQNNELNFTSSNVIGPSVARLASDARRLANMLIVDHHDCIPVQAQLDINQVRSTANSLADASVRAPVAVPTLWWQQVDALHNAFQAAVSTWLSSTASIVTKSILRQP